MHSTISSVSLIQWRFLMQVIRAGGLAGTAPGKYDPAAPLLGALAGPQPDSPDDPLRLAIRRAAQV